MICQSNCVIQYLLYVFICDLFYVLAVFHSLETAMGCDNHYLNLVRMISRKYLKLRIKKICRDKALQKSHGNSILRSRVFRGLWLWIFMWNQNIYRIILYNYMHSHTIVKLKTCSLLLPTYSYPFWHLPWIFFCFSTTARAGSAFNNKAERTFSLHCQSPTGPFFSFNFFGRRLQIL